MKVIVAGSRTMTDAKVVREAFEASGFLAEMDELIHGGCRGVDAVAHKMFDGVVPTTVFPADWKQHGRAAGPIRNREMAAYGDVLVAVWDGQSRGTKNMIEEARAKGLQVHIHRYGG